MIKKKITKDILDNYRRTLKMEEKSAATIEKYMRDITTFREFAGGRKITKELAIEFKTHLKDSGYAVNSVNSMIASLNHFLEYLGLKLYKVKNLRTQRKTYSKEEEELTKEEYERLVNAAEKKPRLSVILQTICGTGIRVSELKYFTVEDCKKGEVTVSCKNKTRTILIPRKLQNVLIEYCKKEKIESGAVFLTRNGKPVNRSNIWSDMKKLCEAANVPASKVFPHNLRKLFARTFYKLEKDIAKLADILGHSHIETTRIYIRTTGAEHRACIEKMELVTG